MVVFFTISSSSTFDMHACSSNSQQTQNSSPINDMHGDKRNNHYYYYLSLHFSFTNVVIVTYSLFFLAFQHSQPVCFFILSLLIVEILKKKLLNKKIKSKYLTFSIRKNLSFKVGNTPEYSTQITTPRILFPFNFINYLNVK